VEHREVKKIDGLYMPDIMTGPARYDRGWAELAPFIKSGRAAVQAGGHIGIFPRELSKRFDIVYTFEPDAENFACLVRNAPGSKVFPIRAFVGDLHECRELRINSKSTGGHSVGGLGETPTLRIDDLALEVCDLILLDLEGYEFFALLGAMQTIARCKPRIIVEENKKSGGQGFQAGAIATLLASRAYRPAATVGENIVFESRK
jgi:FkbM family methyltransferase